MVFVHHSRQENNTTQLDLVQKAGAEKERSWISARHFPTEESHTYTQIAPHSKIHTKNASQPVVNALKRAGCRTHPPQIAVTQPLCHARWKSLDDVADKKC